MTLSTQNGKKAIIELNYSELSELICIGINAMEYCSSDFVHGELIRRLASDGSRTEYDWRCFYDRRFWKASEFVTALQDFREEHRDDL